MSFCISIPPCPVKKLYWRHRHPLRRPRPPCALPRNPQRESERSVHLIYDAAKVLVTATANDGSTDCSSPIRCEKGTESSKIVNGSRSPIRPSLRCRRLETISPPRPLFLSRAIRILPTKSHSSSPSVRVPLCVRMSVWPPRAAVPTLSYFLHRVINHVAHS